MADQEEFAEEDLAAIVMLGVIVLASSFILVQLYFLIKVCHGVDRKESISLSPFQNTQSFSRPLQFSFLQEYYSCERAAVATSIGLMTSGISFISFLLACGDIDWKKGIMSAAVSIGLGIAIASAMICIFHCVCGSVIKNLNDPVSDSDQDSDHSQLDY